MKKIIYTAVAAALVAMASCSSQMEETVYEGNNFVQFSDSIYNMPVTKDEPVFEVPVVMSRAASEDRNVIVDVDLSKTNATEGYHFTIESRNVTIPAGKLVGKARLHGVYDHIANNDSLAITLRIVGEEALENKMYGTQTNVQLVKCMPFNIDDYVGDLVLTCTFPYSTSYTSEFLCSSVKVNDSTLVVKAPFEDNRDLRLDFHTGKNNPFDRNIDMKEQVAFTDVNFGQLSMATVPNAPSYYLPADRAFVLYLDAYLVGLGTFGSYYYIFQWISPDEAVARKNGLTTLQ